MTIKVLLADDHPVVRSGIRSELARQTDIEVIGEATDGDSALHLGEALHPDVVLLDNSMPGLTAVQVIRGLLAEPNPPRILVFTAYGDQDHVRNALQAGALGYLLKDEEPSAISEGVRAVAHGKIWLSAMIASSLISHIADTEALTWEGALSGRELEVLHLIAHGNSNAQVAETLSITERTVRYHLRNIYSKLGMERRCQLIAWAARTKLGAN